MGIDKKMWVNFVAIILGKKKLYFVHDVASKTNYMAMSRDQHTGRSHTIEIKNNSKRME